MDPSIPEESPLRRPPGETSSSCVQRFMAAVGDFVFVKWASNIQKEKTSREEFWSGVMCQNLMSSELKCSGDLGLQHWVSISTGEEDHEVDQIWCEKTVVSMREWLLSLSSLLLWSNHHQRVLLMLSTIFKNCIFVYKSLYILDSLVICSPYSLQSLDCRSNNSWQHFHKAPFPISTCNGCENKVPKQKYTLSTSVPSAASEETYCKEMFFYMTALHQMIQINISG